MNKLSFVLVMSFCTFTMNVIAYGDLSQGLPHNFCQDICQSQKSHKYITTSNMNLVGQDITCLDLSGSHMPGSDLTDAIALCTNFSKANLSGANLSNTNVLGANFTGANLALATATAKQKKTSPDASRVINFYSIYPYGFQGLFFHGLDLQRIRTRLSGIVRRYFWSDSIVSGR